MQTPYEIRVMPPEARFIQWDGKTSSDRFEIQFYEDHIIFDFSFTVADGQSIANPTTSYRLDGELSSRGLAVIDRPPRLGMGGWTKEFNPLISWSRFFVAGNGEASLLVMGCIIPTSSPAIVPLPEGAFCRYRNRYDLRNTLI